MSDVYEYAPNVELESKSDGEGNQESVVALLAVMDEPSCFRDAVDNSDWVHAMDNEMWSICKNGT